MKNGIYQQGSIIYILTYILCSYHLNNILCKVFCTILIFVRFYFWLFGIARLIRKSYFVGLFCVREDTYVLPWSSWTFISLGRYTNKNLMAFRFSSALHKQELNGNQIRSKGLTWSAPRKRHHTLSTWVWRETLFHPIHIRQLRLANVHRWWIWIGWNSISSFFDFFPFMKVIKRVH